MNIIDLRIEWLFLEVVGPITHQGYEDKLGYTAQTRGIQFVCTALVRYKTEGIQN